MNVLKHAIKTGVLIGACLFGLPTLATELNRIVAVVDSGVILASDVEARLTALQQQAQSRGEQFVVTDGVRAQILERLILEQAQLEIAKRRGLVIDDGRLNATLRQIADNRKLSLAELRAELEANGQSYTAFREQIRRELLINLVREREVRARIRVSDAEVERFLETTGGQISTAPQLLLSQIVVALPNRPSPEVIQAAQEKVLQIRGALLQGASFAELAVRFSDGPEANNGGDLGWRNLLELNPVFTEALRDAKANTLVGPIRSPGGFHLIAVRDRQGDQSVVVTEYNTRHILIKPDAVRSPEKARALTQTIRDELAGGAAFDALARQYSEDPLSAAKGGELGWIRTEQVVPGFADAIASLPIGTLSEVVESRFGFHLIEVLATREADISEEQLKNRARRILTERKLAQELDNWLRQIRTDAFVDLK
ncbi:MAG: peptidylprolyl isomerase [Litorivicinaceae bacterium]